MTWAALSLGLVMQAARGQTGDTVDARQLAPGVEYRHFIDQNGPNSIHLVRVDLRRSDLEIRALRPHDALTGREKPSEMARRSSNDSVTVLAAVNGDFFNLDTGENENNQVIGGEWWKGLKVTDSPYDTYDNTHIQFGIDQRGKPLMDRFMFDGVAFDRTAATPIITVNFNPSGKPEGTALFTHRFGGHSPRDTTRQTVEVTLGPLTRRGDTLLYVVRGPASPASGSAIPAQGAILSAYGAGARSREVQAMKPGDTIRVLLTTLPRVRGGSPRLLIGGWPRILRDGDTVAGEAPVFEGTISRNAEMRHGRTAVGFSRDSTTLLLLTVDGRSDKSVGVTLVELANLMRRLGAWQAMNLDGGGSTTMVVDGAVVNVPSDATGEREVGNVLAVLRKR
jgi:hypothetical protein